MTDEKRIIELNNKYESKVYLIDKKKLIYKLHCTCSDFIYRRIKKEGQFSDIKYFDEPCKHLKQIVEVLKKQGYTLKQPKKMKGTIKCSRELRLFLIERSGGICETSTCGDIGKVVHRKIRGINGGLYNKDNCVLLCNQCHKKIHSGEFR